MRRIRKPGSDPEGYLLTSSNEPAGPQITTEQLAAALLAGMDDLGRAHGLPQLRWYWRTLDAIQVHPQLIGMASSGDYDDRAAEHAVTVWAEALGLQPIIPMLDGTTEYTGDSGLGRLGITVWGITDHDNYERDSQL